MAVLKKSVKNFATQTVGGVSAANVRETEDQRIREEEGQCKKVDTLAKQQLALNNFMHGRKENHISTQATHSTVTEFTIDFSHSL